MSSCLTGGGRAAYRLESLNLDCIKSPSSATSWASNTSSPSSTLSEPPNSPFAISTRKPRTPRKRPNQTYNEAAAILSTAYPKIFPIAKHLTKPPRSKLNKDQENTENNSSKSPSLFEPSALLVPFQVVGDDSGFLLSLPVLERPHLPKGINPFEKSCLSPGEIDSGQCLSDICEENQEHFNPESMLDEDIGEGIDSLMGNTSMEHDINTCYNNSTSTTQADDFVYGYPVGLGFDSDYYGMRREFRAMRDVDEGDWWRFPGVNVVDLNPNMQKTSADNKNKKKKRNVENKKSISELVAKDSSSSKVKAQSDSPLACKKINEEDVPPLTNAGLKLKLDYDAVLNSWTDKASPFTGNDVQARLAQVDLFSGGIREANVLRYKEKRRTRLFSKKIRYQVRKVNADRRPRIKGRFVRTPEE